MLTGPTPVLQVRGSTLHLCRDLIRAGLLRGKREPALSTIAETARDKEHTYIPFYSPQLCTAQGTYVAVALDGHSTIQPTRLCVCVAFVVLTSKASYESLLTRANPFVVGRSKATM